MSTNCRMEGRTSKNISLEISSSWFRVGDDCLRLVECIFLRKCSSSCMYSHSSLPGRFIHRNTGPVSHTRRAFCLTVTRQSFAAFLFLCIFCLFAGEKQRPTTTQREKKNAKKPNKQNENTYVNYNTTVYSPSPVTVKAARQVPVACRNSHNTSNVHNQQPPHTHHSH